MIGKAYKSHVENVLSLYNRYEKKREFDDGVDKEYLLKRINNLKERKFLLSVAGEVKAGKSTFINALLGREILPSDVLQATSAIVEIFKAQESFVKIKYADGKEDIIYDDPLTPDIDEAIEKLKEISKLSDEYRDIPTTLIDNLIANSDEKIELTPELLEYLKEQSGIKDLNEKQQKIKEYIAKRKKEDIPIKIEFGYPLNWEYDLIRLVDTPGVNAIGGVQNLTFNFLEEADAILFVHPIKPIESESFKKFLTKVISNQSRESVFLILTHAGLYDEEEIEKLHREAIRIYKNYVPSERILVVDSLLKLIYEDFNRGLSVKEIRQNKQKKKILSSYREKAEDENRDLKEVVYDASGFPKMLSVLEEFLMQAPHLQLRSILEKIKEGYQNLEKQYENEIYLLNEKKRNPQEFEKEINDIQRELEKFKNKIFYLTEEFNEKYSGTHSKLNLELEKIQNIYLEKINESSEVVEIRKHIADFQNELEKTANIYNQQLILNFKEEYEKIGEQFEEKTKIVFPKIDFSSIQSKAESEAEEPIYGKRKWDKWDILTIGIARLFRENIEIVGYEINKKKYLTILKQGITQEITKNTNKIRTQIKNTAQRYIEELKEKIPEVIAERNRHLEELKTKKESNDEIIQKIEEVEKKKQQLQEDFPKIEEILEDLK